MESCLVIVLQAAQRGGHAHERGVRLAHLSAGAQPCNCQLSPSVTAPCVLEARGGTPVLTPSPGAALQTLASPEMPNLPAFVLRWPWLWSTCTPAASYTATSSQPTSCWPAAAWCRCDPQQPRCSRPRLGVVACRCNLTTTCLQCCSTATLATLAVQLTDLGICGQLDCVFTSKEAGTPQASIAPRCLCSHLACCAGALKARPVAASGRVYKLG